jgi:hypothetical protein
MRPSGSLGNSNVFLRFSIDVVVVGLWLREGVVVANYPQMTGNRLVPENPTTMQSVPSGVYADAELIYSSSLWFWASIKAAKNRHWILVSITIRSLLAQARKSNVRLIMREFTSTNGSTLSSHCNPIYHI